MRTMMRRILPVAAAAAPCASQALCQGRSHAQTMSKTTVFSTSLSSMTVRRVRTTRAVGKPIRLRLSLAGRRSHPGASFERLAHPAGVRVHELIGGPVVLVELQRDHFRRVVPSDGLEPHRRAIRPSGDRAEKRIEVRSWHPIDFHDPTARIQAIARGRGTVGEVTDVHTHWRNSALGAHCTMWRLQGRPGPLHESIDVGPGLYDGLDLERLLAVAAPDGDSHLVLVRRSALGFAEARDH